MSWLLRQLGQRVTRGDVGGATALLVRTLSDQYYERRFAVSTARMEDTSDLGFTNHELHCYEATDYRTLFAVIRSMRIRPGQDVFVDIGAGKGRALIVAATFPFKRIVGVELSEPLVQLARRNIEAARSRLVCQDVQVLCADATTVPVPDDATVVFLFNPFHGDVMVRALLNVKASITRRPRSLRLVLVNPRHVDDAVREAMAGWLVPAGRVSALAGEFPAAVFETRSS